MFPKSATVLIVTWYASDCTFLVKRFMTSPIIGTEHVFLLKLKMVNGGIFINHLAFEFLY